ncbi:MAG TPA: zinc ribbon domain-containing protein [Abditibacteriaceae bacterium]|nr:zinc ribbon domain-containing protein [Abditibacteriaceae bacterium]
MQNVPPAHILEGRRAMYYGGMLLIIVGFFLFISVFFSGFSSGRFPSESVVIVEPSQREMVERNRNMIGIPKDARIVTSDSPNAYRTEPANPIVHAFWGMGLIITGAMLMSFGSRGLAGSGVILDPQQVREDLKPWSHMAGGMIDDAATQSQTLSRITGSINANSNAGEEEQTVKVRCAACRTLNDEEARFCDQCGAAL